MKGEIFNVRGRDLDAKFLSRILHFGLSIALGFWLGLEALWIVDKALNLNRSRFIISPGSAALNVIPGFNSALDAALAINTIVYATLIYATSSVLLRLWFKIQDNS
jgi:hypothetical protein